MIICKHSPMDIAKWHEKTFPDANLPGQLEKLEEEKKEWSYRHKIDELADVYIVACGLLRFRSLHAAIAFHFVEEQCMLFKIMSEDLLNAIDRKMEINYSRCWKLTNDGVYHHI